MNGQIEIRQLMTSELNRIKTQNPSFSLRAFAKKAGVVPSALSGILNGKRKVTEKMALRILERLTISPEAASTIISSLRADKFDGVASDNSKFVRINMDQYHVTSEWYYYGILSLAETDGFRTDPNWIAKRLNIKVRQAATALERLERLQMLKRSGSKLVPTGIQFETTADIANLSLRKSHFENLELAKRSLEVDELKERDFSSMTMAIDPERLPEAKKMIKNFRRRLCAYLESGKKAEVYKICIQLFPLTGKGS